MNENPLDYISYICERNTDLLTCAKITFVLRYEKEGFYLCHPVARFGILFS